jgi:Fe-S-cluster containining protein
LRFTFPEDVHFGCSKCGLCCGDTPKKTRHILLLESDAKRIAAQTKCQIKSFADETTNKAPYVYEMRKTAKEQKCVFLQNNECTVYEVRPLICRFYPFELSKVVGVYKFEVTDECPGVLSLDTLIGVGKKLGGHYFRSLLELALVEFDNCSI